MKPWGLGLVVKVVEFRVWGLKFKVWGLGFRVRGLGFVGETFRV